MSRYPRYVRPGWSSEREDVLTPGPATSGLPIVVKSCRSKSWHNDRGAWMTLKKGWARVKLNRVFLSLVAAMAVAFLQKAAGLRG